jgi:hypothetical protein
VDLIPGQRYPVGLGLGPVENGPGRSEVVFPHDRNAVDRSVTGFMRISAASGDEVYASVTGISMFRPDGVVADLERFGTIEGGTDRFLGAGGPSRSSARSPGARGT